MNQEQLLKEKRNEIMLLAQHYGVSNIRVFGSVARGEATESSDIDLLIDLEPQRNLLDFIALKIALENLLGCKVDLAETENLHETIRDKVLKESVLL